MSDIPALAEHLANMVTAHDTPRYRSVLNDSIRFLERELKTALTAARKQGAQEERERLACEAEHECLLVASPRDASDGEYLASWIRAQISEA